MIMDDASKRIQQQFGPNADKYATSTVHAQGASLGRLVELTQPQATWQVLDVSTGAGHTALTFAPHVARVTATDLTPEMLQTAQRLAAERSLTNMEFKPADVQKLPFADGTFDLVTSRLALHHYADARQAIAEMARVCKPGGLVAVVDNIVPPDKVTAGYINHFEKLRDPSHNWAYPQPRLEAYFADAHLALVHSETISKDMEFDPFCDRMNVDPETRVKLRQLLLDSPDAVKAFLTPHMDGDKLVFALHEAIIVGKKGKALS
jgi:ubiquinone/menaquinone biosynthesis C-methylase UbiE